MGVSLVLGVLALCGPAEAQVSAQSLVIGQAGNVIGLEPRDRSDLYTRVDAGWSQDAFRLGVRFESDRSNDDRRDGGRLAAYEGITQRFAEWEGEGLALRVGQFNTILGRGLLHRSWELPGVVLDEPATQTRYAATRDLDGAQVRFDCGPVETQVFQGRVNDGTVSPATEKQGGERYRGVLDGAQLALRLPRGSRVGAAWTRFAFGSAPSREHATGFAEADPLRLAGVTAVSLPLTLEYALERGSLGDWFEFARGPERAHALHASAGVLWGRYTLAAEIKDYDGFRLGYNDPPSLVREHGAPLLNRDTHLLDAEGEHGFQVELSGPLHRWAAMTANLSRSDGEPGVRYLRFEEAYTELHVAPPEGEAWELSVFGARGQDTFDFITERISGGVLGSVTLPRALSIGFDLEQKRVESTPFFGAPTTYRDQFLSLSLAHPRLGSAALSVTRTSDPRDLPTDLFGEPTASRATFVGVTLAGRVRETHELTLFAGRRRGGRACVSGTCYDVPSLEGAELRVVSRF